MRKVLGVSKKAAFFALFMPLVLSFLLAEGDCYLKGDVDNDNNIGLTEAIHSLQVTSGSRSALASKTINVPTDIPTIQEAIDAAAEGDTIVVAEGTYNESLTILKDLITLQGAARDTTIIDGGGENVITIDGGHGVKLSTFTVRNGYEGVLAKRNASLEVTNVTVQDCADEGVQVDENSTAQINDCTVLRSGDDGIGVARNSSTTFSGSIISNNNTGDGLSFGLTSSGFFIGSVTANENGRRGIQVDGSSSLLCFGSTTTAKNNGNDGVIAFAGSSITLGQNDGWLLESNAGRGLCVAGSSELYMAPNSTLTMRGNQERGFQVVESSSAEILGTVLIENNNNLGILVNMTSTIFIGGSGSVTVTGTSGGGGIGVQVAETSAFKMNGGSLVIENSAGGYGVGLFVLRGANFTCQEGTGLSVKIRNNGREGIGIYQQSSARLEPGTEITGNSSDGLRVGDNSMLYALGVKVQNNTKWGLWADDGSTANLQNCTINGNTDGDVALRFGSRGTLNGNMIGSLSCDGTVLSRGDMVCPQQP